MDNIHSLDLDLFNVSKSQCQISCRPSHITSDPRTGPIKLHPVYVLCFVCFFVLFSVSQLIPLQLLDNTNRSQANGTEQDNGAFIAA